MAIAALSELQVLLPRTMTAVVRQPVAPETADDVHAMVQLLDRVIEGPELALFAQLAPGPQRSSIAEMFQHVADNLRDMLSVPEQIAQLGGSPPPYGADLAAALGRLEMRLNQLGLPIGPSTRPTPIVIPSRIAPYAVADVTRRPELDPYIERALRSARVRELKPGYWYADLEGFPGAWADGESPEECLSTLADVLHEWLIIKMAHGDPDIPVVDNLHPFTLLTRR